MTRPDSPCIGVCTTLYTEICDGCGRQYLEVAQWNGMTPEQREAIWQRIEREGTAWYFTRYKERAKQ